VEEEEKEEEEEEEEAVEEEEEEEEEESLFKAGGGGGGGPHRSSREANWRTVRAPHRVQHTKYTRTHCQMPPVRVLQRAPRQTR